MYPCLSNLVVSSLDLCKQNLGNYKISNCEITTPYAGFEGMLLSMCGKLTIEKLKVSLLSYKSVQNLPFRTLMLRSR